MCVPHVSECPRRPEGRISSSEAGFTEDYELPDGCAGNWLWMLWKSQPQSPLSQWASLRPQQVSFIKPLFPSSPFSFSFIWGKYVLFFWVDYLLASISKNWIIYIASSCYFHCGLSFHKARNWGVPGHSVAILQSQLSYLLSTCSPPSLIICYCFLNQCMLDHCLQDYDS